jgi:hypothetical protein
MLSPASHFPYRQGHEKAFADIHLGFYYKIPRLDCLRSNGCSSFEKPEQLLRLRLDKRSRCSVDAREKLTPNPA